MVRCPSCNEIVPTSRKTCYCGASMKGAVTRGKKSQGGSGKTIGIYLMILAFIIMIVGAIIGMIRVDKEVNIMGVDTTMPTYPFLGYVPVFMMGGLAVFWLGVWQYKKG